MPTKKKIATGPKAKKKIATGPKAKLMKKNLAQLKAQAKKLKIKGFSTKKKEALVNSIMMAQARNNKGKAKKRTMAESDYTPTGTRRSIKRMAKKRGAPANRVMRNPARTGRTFMSEYNGWPNYETWLMNLWYGDYFYDYVTEGIEEGYIDIEDQKDPYALGEILKDQVEELIEMDGQVPSNGFVHDLFNGKVNTPMKIFKK